MGTRSLKDSFVQAVSGILGLKERPALPYAHVVNIFGFASDRFVTERHKEWDIRHYLKQDLGRTDSFAPGRVFYADPADKISIRQPWPPDSIYEEPPPVEVLVSPAIMAFEDKHDFGRTLMVVIRDRVRDVEKPFDTMVFGLYGTRKGDGRIKLHKILVPEINSARQMTGLRKVDLHDRNDIAGALAYAKLCVDQLMTGGSFLPRDNMQGVLAGDNAGAQSLPWIKRGPAP